MIVNYPDGTVDLGQVRLTTPTSGYVPLPELSVTLTQSNPIQIRVLIWSRNSIGRAYFDDLSLTLASGVIPMP